MATAAAATLTAIAAAAVATAAAVVTWWHPANGQPPAPSAAAHVTTALGHASTCTCHLVAFAALVYALSAYCGVRVVRLSADVCGRRDVAAYLRRGHWRPDATLSWPGGATAAVGSSADSSADGDDGGGGLGGLQHGRVEHHRRRKIKSAAPLLQRYIRSYKCLRLNVLSFFFFVFPISCPFSTIPRVFKPWPTRPAWSLSKFCVYVLSIAIFFYFDRI